MRVGRILLYVGMAGQWAGFVLISLIFYEPINRIQLSQLGLISFFGVITVVGAIGTGAEHILKAMKGKYYHEEVGALTIGQIVFLNGFCSTALFVGRVTDLITHGDHEERLWDDFFYFKMSLIIFISGALAAAIIFFIEPIVHNLLYGKDE